MDASIHMKNIKQNEAWLKYAAQYVLYLDTKACLHNQTLLEIVA